MELTVFGKTYNLDLEKSYYTNNHRTFFGLLDEEGPFADLSENHPEISNSKIFGHLPEHEAIVINNDFIACFPSERECKIWIRDNIPECVITGDLEGRPVFYIKQTSTQGN